MCLFYQQYYEDEAEDRGKVLNFVKLNVDGDDKVCLKTKEWTPLENGHIEHKFYCEGELVMVEELKGKTVVVELIGRDVDAPEHPSCP